MVLKPIPLSAFTPTFIPPVTGVGGSSAPIANSFDSSGLFPYRSRSSSANKRRRGEEIDLVFDRSEAYPPLHPPAKPSLNIPVIRELVVAATAAGGEIRDLLDDAEADPKMKSIGKLTLALLSVAEAMLEGGFVPLSSSGSRDQTTLAPRRRGSTASQPPILLPKPMPAGLKELKEGLERAEKESVLFDANLGPEPIANRNSLATALSSGIRAAAVSTATDGGTDTVEAVRIMEDALSCVADMEFLGQRSKQFYNKADASDTRNGKFCSMPVKFKFDEKEARINFERSIKQNCKLKAVMSLPQPIRKEQSAFIRALRQRYPNRIVTARPDISSLELVAFMKNEGASGWTRCWETVAIPHGILLPGYNPREVIILPPTLQVEETGGPPTVEGSMDYAGAAAC